MTKLLLLLVSSLILASLLGLGADFRSYDAQRTFKVAVVADDQEFIDLTPIQPYAYIHDDGKIYFDFSQFNPNYPGGGIGVSPMRLMPSIRCSKFPMIFGQMTADTMEYASKFQLTETLQQCWIYTRPMT